MEDLKTSDTWRVFKIQSELVEGFETLVSNGTISKEDFSFFSIVDKPDDVRFLINEHFRAFGCGKNECPPGIKNNIDK